MESALATPTHANIGNLEERARLLTWASAGAPAGRPAVHPSGFGNPRTEGNHAQLLRDRLYRPLADSTDADACGTCHDGAGARPERVKSAAEGAPACTTCHTQPEGVQACGTCHGDGAARAYPPRDACLFPNAKPDSAHRTHIDHGLSCPSCHAVGAHMDGKVDVACTGTCHAHGGARPTPVWNQGPMTCNDCHSSPPKDHYAGDCKTCHKVDASVHVNGKIDLGDGSGRCGACHGQGDDPRPTTGAHQKHLFDCVTCHEGPGPKHPLGTGVKMRLGGAAARGGRRPVFDAATKSCSGTYCHEGNGGAQTAPAWTDGPTTCNSCHSSPPPLPNHPQTNDCASCHPVPGSGKTHIDGAIELRQP